MQSLEEIRRTSDILVNASAALINEEYIEVFDPRIDFDGSGKEDKGVVWTTKSVDLAYQAIEEGKALRLSPFFRKDPNLRKANLVFQYTEEELIEILRCKKDIMYFAGKYVMLKTSDGIKNIKLRGYQKKLLKAYQDNRWMIVLQSRQSGKTTMTGIFFTWMALFHTDKTLAVVAQRDQIAKEVFGKIRGIITYLPFFLKPGCVGFTPSSFAFDNGCKGLYRHAGIDTLQGYTIDCMFVDEFAFIRNTRAKEFWENAYPTLSSIKDSRVIICSTPNGRNLFHKMWNDALEKKSLFNWFRVDYWEVPGRDEVWKDQEVRNLGSEEAFDQQYGLSFDTKVKNILKKDTFQYLDKIKAKFRNTLFNIGTDYDEYFRWSTQFKYSFRKDWFTLSVDIGEGLGGDYSTIKIKKLVKISKNNFKHVTIGIFECNSIEISEFALVIAKLMSKFTQDYCRLIIERNSFGDLLILHMDTLVSKFEHLEIELETYAKFKRKDGAKLERGLRLNSKFKKLGVSSWKTLVNDKNFIETDEETINQYREFGEDERGNFKASIGHDDLVMPDVNLGYYIQSNENSWSEFIEDFLETSEIDEYNLRIFNTLDIHVVNQIHLDEAELYNMNEYASLDIAISDLSDEVVSEYDFIFKPTHLKEESEYDFMDELTIANNHNKELHKKRGDEPRSMGLSKFDTSDQNDEMLIKSIEGLV